VRTPKRAYGGTLSKVTYQVPLALLDFLLVEPAITAQLMCQQNPLDKASGVSSPELRYVTGRYRELWDDLFAPFAIHSSITGLVQ